MDNRAIQAMVAEAKKAIDINAKVAIRVVGLEKGMFIKNVECVCISHSTTVLYIHATARDGMRLLISPDHLVGFQIGSGAEPG